MRSALRGGWIAKYSTASMQERCLASVETALTTVAGEPTELHQISVADCALNVVIIPGNPGMSGFYVPYMQHLHNALGGRAQITSVTHVGMGRDPCSVQRAHGLTEQIAHKAAFLREHMLQPGQPPCVLIGHSIGAYMALAATKLIEGHGAEKTESVPQIAQVLLLFPFLEVDRSSWRQWALKQLVRLPTPVAAVAAAVGCLPDILKRLIVKSCAGAMNKQGVETTLHLLQFINARAALYLGSCEFRDLHAPVAAKSWRILEHLGKRAAVICAPRDLWHPAQHFRDLVAALPHLDASVEDAQEHAFCVSDELSEALAVKSAAILLPIRVFHLD